MRVAHILHNKVHWIFNPNVVFGINEMPNLPPDAEGNPTILIDITDRPEVVEGWGYNKETGEVSEPVVEVVGVVEEDVSFSI